MRCPHCNEEFPLHVKHSRTSEAAGESVVHAMTGLRLKVLEFLLEHPSGHTDEEIQEALAMNPNTQRPRRVELVAMNKVADSGAVRDTRSGTKAVVWVAVRQQQELFR